MVSTFFSSAKAASSACAILYLLFFVPYQLIQLQIQNQSLALVTTCSLSFNFAMAVGWNVIGFYEELGMRLTWSNLFTNPTNSIQYSMGVVMVMQVVDIVLYLLVTWYVENVFPGEFGVARPWYFVFQPSYWTGRRPADADPWAGEVCMTCCLGLCGIPWL
jgi:hypothetical protein